MCPRLIALVQIVLRSRRKGTACRRQPPRKLKLTPLVDWPKFSLATISRPGVFSCAPGRALDRALAARSLGAWPPIADRWRSLIGVSDFIHPLEDQWPFFCRTIRDRQRRSAVPRRTLENLLRRRVPVRAVAVDRRVALPQVLMLAPVPSPAPGKQAGDTRWETHPNRTDIRKKWTPAPGTPRDLRSAQVFRADRGSVKKCNSHFSPGLAVGHSPAAGFAPCPSARRSRALACASGPDANAQYRALICASAASSFGVSFRRDRRLRHRYSIFSLSVAACCAL